MIFISPCFLEEEQYKEYYNKVILSTDNSLSDNYYELEKQKFLIAEKAKLFIMENYKSVKDWTDLEISITCNHKGHYENYITEKRAQTRFGTFIVNRIANPIETITFVLDYSDGDLSVTVNNREFRWIEADTVIDICNYIEKQLIKQTK